MPASAVYAAALALAFLRLAACAVHGASGGLAEAVIRGVEHREQLISNIHSMKAIWQEDRLHTPQAAAAGGLRVREVFLVEGEKERVERVLTRLGEGQGKDRVVGTGPADVGAGGRVGMVPLPSGTRIAFVYDGRSGWAFLPTAAGRRSRPGWSASAASWSSPAMGSWAGIAWRFELEQARARLMTPSWQMRGAPATVDRLAGPPERYKVAVRDEAHRERCVWWVAPDYGYAVTRRQTDYDYPEHTRFIQRYEGFKQLSAGIWLPSRSESRGYLLRRNGKWELVDHSSAAAEVMKLNIDIPDDYFRVPEAK